MVLLRDDLECSICLDTITKINITVTKCGHIFHESCIKKLFEASTLRHVCPLCRGNINSIHETQSHTQTHAPSHNYHQFMQEVPLMVNNANPL